MSYSLGVFLGLSAPTLRVPHRSLAHACTATLRLPWLFSCSEVAYAAAVSALAPSSTPLFTNFLAKRLKKGGKKKGKKKGAKTGAAASLCVFS